MEKMGIDRKKRNKYEISKYKFGRFFFTFVLFQVDTDYVMIPFSDEMSDYDMNNDKRISYPEFASTVFNLVDLKNPDRLLEIFMFSDFNGRYSFLLNVNRQIIL